ncbi:MAG: hypothetical protein OEZ36_09500 [Spirochaetota bacterium]|nr:hypothetical protein [Spirochaetota bacterium]
MMIPKQAMAGVLMDPSRNSQNSLRFDECQVNQMMTAESRKKDARQSFLSPVPRLP